MTGRRSHGRLSALNGVVHQGIGEGSAFVFVAVDHCTTECIGLHAAKSGSRFEALEPIR